MIYYLDTSALVKRYYTERGSAWVHRLFQPENALVASKVAYAELLAALARKRREKEISEADFTHAVESFQQEWQEFVVVEVTEAVFTDLLSLVQRHPLRGFDAIHLCTALWFRKRMKADLVFVGADATFLLRRERKDVACGTLNRRNEEGCLVPRATCSLVRRSPPWVETPRIPSRHRQATPQRLRSGGDDRLNLLRLRS